MQTKVTIKLEEQSELLAEILEWQKGSDKYGLEGR